jgi:hypothetical protein
MTVSTGLVAGKLWHYIDKHGPSTVTNMAKVSGIDLKNVNIAIGWLAKKDKVPTTINGRVETISLK